MGFRISFTLVLTVLTLILSLVPAVVIWVVFMDLMTSSVDLLKGTTQTSTDSMAKDMQSLMIAQAMEKLQARLTEGQNDIAVQIARVQASGFLNLDLHPSRIDLLSKVINPYSDKDFPTLKGHQYFSSVALTGAIWKNGSTSLVTNRLFWILWLVIYIDLMTGVTGTRTLYQSRLIMQPDEKSTQLIVSYPDQATGALFPIQVNTLPYLLNGVLAPSGWDTNEGFNAYTGELEIGVWQWLPALNDTWVQVTVSINTQTMSAELADQLAGSPMDRLVIFFTQPHGHLIATSHGKWYSHSDVDRRSINPLTNPPNLTAYSLWDCLQSNDTLIPLACQQLIATYQSWELIPVLQTEMVLNGMRYWVAADKLTTNLKCTVLMLKNRATVMGKIDASSTQVDNQVSSKKGVTFIVLGVVTALAILLPLGVGLWLAARLMRLAAGMDQIAKLQFQGHQTSPTVFRELHRFQTSFIQMERGLQAFGKFVPQAVVKVLIAGKMQANDEMNPDTLTIMFADIEGFSTVCENETPAVLVSVCTEYFEAMCSNIVNRNGTIDKFIGDCIMAMWNAPERLAGHEKDAVAASLGMQASVMELHGSWKRRGLPMLKFRVGIHTGVCLVGNFGCSYRVSYTCLGDGVNLAARLEALNKKFGTHICVSHATYEGCKGAFHFRKLAKVTVPGKAEVLPVYEVLCGRETTDPAYETPSPRFDLPGSVRKPPEELELLSEGSSEPALSPTVIRVCSSGPLYDPSDVVKPKPDEVPYHWRYVLRQTVLDQAKHYEAAYSAMVAGDLAKAQRLFADTGALTIPDKACTTLAEQLKRLTAAQPWDGVFYFREK